MAKATLQFPTENLVRVWRDFASTRGSSRFAPGYVSVNGKRGVAWKKQPRFSGLRSLFSWKYRTRSTLARFEYLDALEAEVGKSLNGDMQGAEIVARGDFEDGELNDTFMLARFKARKGGKAYEQAVHKIFAKLCPNKPLETANIILSAPSEGDEPANVACKLKLAEQARECCKATDARSKNEGAQSAHRHRDKEQGKHSPTATYQIKKEIIICGKNRTLNFVKGRDNPKDVDYARNIYYAVDVAVKANRQNNVGRVSVVPTKKGAKLHYDDTKGNANNKKYFKGDPDATRKRS